MTYIYKPIHGLYSNICRPTIIKEIPHYYVFGTAGFAIPSDLLAEAKNPHCLYLTWKRAISPVNGYKVYCFPADSWKPEIIKDITDVNQEYVIISGLKPGTTYRVAITSVSSGIQGKLVFSQIEVKLRKSTMNQPHIIGQDEYSVFLLQKYEYLYFS